MDSSQRITEIHVAQARLRALRLFAFTSSVFPGEWSNSWNEVIVPDLLEFGFHARKVNEFCSLKSDEFPSIDKRIIKISQGDPGGWEGSYRNALNALMHMKSFTMGHAHADHRIIFANSSANLMATYIKVSADRFPEATISIYGLVDCFLSYVIPKIKNANPKPVF